MGTNNANNTDSRIRITTATKQVDTDFFGELVLEASLPYSSYGMLQSGGNFLKNLLTLSAANPNPLTSPCPVSDNPIRMPPRPSAVDTLEKFFLWSCLVLKNSLPFNDSRLTIGFLEENGGGAIIKIVARLPFDYSPWLEKQSVVCNMRRLVSEYVYPSEGNFDNEVPLGNEFLVAN